VFECEVEEIGPALKYATAKVTRSSGGSGGNYNSGPAAGGGGSSWSNSNANSGGGQNDRSGGADPWASAQSEEPPF